MDTVAPVLAEWPRPLVWLRDFLKEELAPYPGRGILVARVVIAATVVMIVTMTFRIPNGAYAGIYAFLVSRVDPVSTVRDAKQMLIAFALGATYTIIGAALVTGDAMLRLLWVVGTLLVIFYGLSAILNYSAAMRFGYIIIITIPIWDLHTTAEIKVENTLWAVLALSVSIVLTAGIELLFAALKPSHDLQRSIDERLDSVEEVVRCYASGQPVGEKISNQITRLGLLGTSRLRSVLVRSAKSVNYGEQMGAAVALVGRLVDLAANLKSLDIKVSDEDRKRFQVLGENVAGIRADLLAERVPHLSKVAENSELAGSIPLLQEMERTVRMITEVFAGSQSLSTHPLLPPSDAPPAKFFAPDAFTNPDHIKFALKGCLAASLCYIIYTGLDWPEISTSVTTCYLTALSTIGASRQKQVLRFIGAAAGGLLGLAAQVFILPSVDSIFGFTLLFLAVTIVASWIATSGPRLSYLGIQFAVAFYLINLQEFKFQNSLTVERDRVVGILLGLMMMWFVFDQLWGVPTAVEMRKAFVSVLRSLAQLARGPFSPNLKVAIEQSYSLREATNKRFDNVRALADGVLFEFGPSRESDLRSRKQIVECQPQLRTLFITQAALLKYRMQLPGFELPEEARLIQQRFQEHLADTLDGMADRQQGKPRQKIEQLEVSFAPLEEIAKTYDASGSQAKLGSNLQTFLALSRRLEQLAVSLDNEI